jgi:hypothetical protein
LDSSRIIVVTTLYYGDLEIAQRSLENISVIMDAKSTANETKTYEIGLASETIFFNLSNLVDEIYSKVNKEMFMTVQVKYQTISKPTNSIISE